MPAVARKAAIVIGLLILIIAAAGAVYYWLNQPTLNARVAPAAADATRPARQNPQAAAQPSSTPAPTTIAARPVNFIAKTTGTLSSANQATLAFQSSGRIKEIKVKEGQTVKAGDILATLETAALDAQVVQAQANLDSAAANLAKVKAGPTFEDALIAKLAVDRAKATLQQAQSAYDAIAWRSDIAMTNQALTLASATSAYDAAVAQYTLTVNHPTDVELKSAQASVASAQASVETAKLNAANARIVAPFDGTVVWLGSRLGESASSGTAAMTIADLPRMQVQLNADEISGAVLQVGQTVRITLDAVPGTVLTGRVTKMGLLASSSSNIVSTPVTIDIDDNSAMIYPGLSATVEFLGKMQ